MLTFFTEYLLVPYRLQDLPGFNELEGHYYLPKRTLLDLILSQKNPAQFSHTIYS